MDQEIKSSGNKSQNLATPSIKSPRPAQQRCFYSDKEIDAAADSLLVDVGLIGNRSSRAWGHFRKGIILGISMGADAMLPMLGVAWQPIETAPVNESVLVFIPNAEHYGEGIYRALKKQTVGERLIWMVTGLHQGRDLAGEDQPTHWMPLPSTPNTQDTNTPASGGTTQTVE